MRMPAAARQEVENLLKRSIIGALLCALFGVYSLARDGGATIIVGAGSLFLAGVLCAGLLIFSWRHCHPYLSWLIWAVPGAALVVGIFEGLVAPTVWTGQVSVLSALGVVAWAGAGFFGALFVFRVHVRRWLMIR